MRITKIYTKTGDKGKTSLVNGLRVSKSDIRIDALGSVDELNSNIGWVHGLVSDNIEIDKKEQTSILSTLLKIQHHLFNISSNLATPAGSDSKGRPPIHEEHVKFLEHEIDKAQSQIPPLKNFILPSGNSICGALHCCRTVCRRSERRMVLLFEKEEFSPFILQYVNRLSDYLFGLARYICHIMDGKEIFWDKNA